MISALNSHKQKTLSPQTWGAFLSPLNYASKVQLQQQLLPEASLWLFYFIPAST